ncbi:MAG: hypothetical protein ACPG4T_04975 [Nannocystaceae bacterium]
MVWGWIVFVLVVFAELVDKRNRQKSRPARVTVRETILDPWIEAGYPPRFCGEHGEHPNPRSSDLRVHRGVRPTPEQLDTRVDELAFGLEFRARRLFAGHSFAAKQRPGTVVWTREAADNAFKLLSDHKPGQAAQTRLDRALAWWVQARVDGATVYEWNEDGYEEISAAFDRLARFATDDAPEIASETHGVTTRRDTTSVPAFTAPARWKSLLRIATATALFVGFAWHSLTSSRPFDSSISAAAPRRSCAEQLEKVEQAAVFVLKRDPTEAAAVERLLAQTRSGQARQAFEEWKQGERELPAAALLEGEVFLLTVCKPAR